MATIQGATPLPEGPQPHMVGGLFPLRTDTQALGTRVVFQLIVTEHGEAPTLQVGLDVVMDPVTIGARVVTLLVLAKMVVIPAVPPQKSRYWVARLIQLLSLIPADAFAIPQSSRPLKFENSVWPVQVP